jgi:hypothetical protein
MLRTFIDYDRFCSPRYPTNLSIEAFKELTEIYYAATAERCVKPPEIKLPWYKNWKKR